MTERLYYDNAQLLEFDAVVADTKREGDTFLSALDRSAFYPTSGGQPFDTGTLNGIRVTDVFVDQTGEVWHRTEKPLETGEHVYGKIDRERRYDHMQQHAADHMIAGALYELSGAVTIGLHIGDSVSSIDVQLSDGATRLDDETIARVEDIVNARIQADDPIRCWFPGSDELAQLPLRKKPTVKEHIRVVAIGDYEMVACGGTHPAHTGEIGLVKILEVTPARGKARVTFVAGKRAFENYRACFKSAHTAANILTTHPDKLPEIVKQLQNTLKDTEKRLKTVQREVFLSQIGQILDGANVRTDGIRVVAQKIDTDAGLLKDLASELIRKPNVIALLAATGGKGCSFVFACSENVETDMAQLLRRSGARGGGRKDFAQGSGTDEVLEAAKQEILGNS